MANRYHTWDESVLDQPAEFKLSATLPESIYPVKNPDGSSPAVSLEVKGSTNRFALAALQQLNEEERIFDVILAKLAPELGEDQEPTDAEAEAIAAKLEEQHSPWLSFDFNASGDEGQSVNLTLLAPSGSTALNVFQIITDRDHLNGLLASLMPEDDVYED